MEQAAAFAKQQHEGQYRKGDSIPYIVHPERVTDRLREAGVEDRTVLAAAWLHDTVEDTSATLDDLRSRFGEDVAALVDWLSHDKPGGQTRQEYNEAFRKADPRACVVKVADRLDNVDEGGLEKGYMPIYAAEGLLLLGLIHRNKRLGRLPPPERHALRSLSKELNAMCAEILWERPGQADVA